MKRKNIKPVQQSPIKSISFKSAFWIVLVLHLLLGLGMFGFPFKSTANAEDLNYVNPSKKEYVGIPDPTPTPTPTPSPTPEFIKEVLPNGMTATYPIEKKPESKYTKEYIVKRGDTFYSIVKRYKLNPEKLKQINNITDPSKIKEGQVLKFM